MSTRWSSTKREVSLFFIIVTVQPQNCKLVTPEPEKKRSGWERERERERRDLMKIHGLGDLTPTPSLRRSQSPWKKIFFSLSSVCLLLCGAELALLKLEAPPSIIHIRWGGGGEKRGWKGRRWTRQKIVVWDAASSRMLSALLAGRCYVLPDKSGETLKDGVGKKCVRRTQWASKCALLQSNIS